MATNDSSGFWPKGFMPPDFWPRDFWPDLPVITCIEAAIYDILKAASAVTALVGGARSPRIYPLGIPKGKPVPAIVFQQISSKDIVTTEGHIDPRDDRFQLTCWDDDPDGARALAGAMRSALAAASGRYGTVIINYCSYEDEGKVYESGERAEALERHGKRQDWFIAYQVD